MPSEKASCVSQGIMKTTQLSFTIFVKIDRATRITKFNSVVYTVLFIAEALCTEIFSRINFGCVRDS